MYIQELSLPIHIPISRIKHKTKSLDLLMIIAADGVCGVYSVFERCCPYTFSALHRNRPGQPIPTVTHSAMRTVDFDLF